MDFNAFLNAGWNDRARAPEAVFARCREATDLVEEPEAMTMFEQALAFAAYDPPATDPGPRGDFDALRNTLGPPGGDVR